MLKVLLAAILVALLALIYLLLPIARPDHRVPASVAVNGAAVSPSTSPPPSSSFVVHNDAPPTPPPAITPPAVTPPAITPPGVASSAAPGDPASLDAVMQRLRATKPDSTVVITPPVSPPATPAANAAPAPALPTPATVPAPVAPAPVIPAPPQRWSNVSGQGVRFRVGRIGDGYVLSIDLGGGQVADVHVLAAFGRLDQAAVDMRVDYLKQTILENFSSSSAGYSYNRDGSVTRER